MDMCPYCGSEDTVLLESDDCILLFECEDCGDTWEQNDCEDE
jgi:translation initiation factor 2 beta subunit (eIF-2beta)/eIF-5